MKPKIRRYRAAGGVVLNTLPQAVGLKPYGGSAASQVLLLERDVIRDGHPLHEIRLPKGKIETGESDAQAALREVGEESGYWSVQILADLGEARTRYIFHEKQTERDEHYFLMALTSDDRAGQRMDPRKEEAKFQPRWAKNLDEAQRLLTYDDEKQFIARARAALQGRGA
ncbi:MAG: NUDIX domain-containing protein [Phycisphaeraceae bacterium]